MQLIYSRPVTALTVAGGVILSVANAALHIIADVPELKAAVEAYPIKDNSEKFHKRMNAIFFSCANEIAPSAEAQKVVNCVSGKIPLADAAVFASTLEGVNKRESGVSITYGQFKLFCPFKPEETKKPCVAAEVGLS